MIELSRDDRDVLGALHARGGELVDRAVDWCAINTGSRNAEGLARQRTVLADALGRLPGELARLALADLEEVDTSGEKVSTPLQPALHLVVRPEAALRVVLTGHYDTVYPSSSPFQSVVARDDGALNGPGIADMKGGLSVMLGALEAFERHPLAQSVGYDVLWSPDEEIGSPGSAAVLADIARRGRIGLTYEPCHSDGALVSMRKGSGNFHVVFAGRSAHAGRAFFEGRNAVAGAATLAARLHALNAPNGEFTVNLAKLDGGGALNVVADRAVLRFNVRAEGPDATVRFEEELAGAIAALSPLDLAITVTGGFHRPAKPVDARQRKLFGAVEAVGALLDTPIHWRPSGGVCEGNNLHAAGLPNVDTLGVRGGDIHSLQEYAWPASFVERAALSAVLLMKIATSEIDLFAL